MKQFEFADIRQNDKQPRTSEMIALGIGHVFWQTIEAEN